MRIQKRKNRVGTSALQSLILVAASSLIAFGLGQLWLSDNPTMASSFGDFIGGIFDGAARNAGVGGSQGGAASTPAASSSGGGNRQGSSQESTGSNPDRSSSGSSTDTGNAGGSNDTNSSTPATENNGGGNQGGSQGANPNPQVENQGDAYKTPLEQLIEQYGDGVEVGQGPEKKSVYKDRGSGATITVTEQGNLKTTEIVYPDGQRIEEREVLVGKNDTLFGEDSLIIRERIEQDPEIFDATGLNQGAKYEVVQRSETRVNDNIAYRSENVVKYEGSVDGGATLSAGVEARKGVVITTERGGEQYISIDAGAGVGAGAQAKDRPGTDYSYSASLLGGYVEATNEGGKSKDALGVGVFKNLTIGISREGNKLDPGP